MEGNKGKFIFVMDEKLQPVRTEAGQQVIFYPHTNTYGSLKIPSTSTSHSPPGPVPEIGVDNSTASKSNFKDMEACQSLPGSSSGSPVHWSHKENLLFISLLKEYQYYQNNNKKKIDIMKEIAAALNSNGYSFTLQQCIGRLKTLSDAYKKTKDHNNTSGNDTKTCKYFTEMESLLGDKPNVEPIAGGSSNFPNRPVLEERNLNKATRKKKSTKNVKRTHLMSWLEKFEERTMSNEERRLQMMQEQHDENINVMKQLIDAIKK